MRRDRIALPVTLVLIVGCRDDGAGQRPATPAAPPPGAIAGADASRPSPDAAARGADVADAGPAQPVDPRVHDELTGPGDIISGLEPVAPPAPEPVRVAGDLDPAVARDRVTAAMPRIRACYEAALATKPDLAGTVRVRFFVTPDGAVASVDWNGAPGLAPAVDRCVADVIRGLRFPRQPDGALVIYPLTFAPNGP